MRVYQNILLVTLTLTEQSFAQNSVNFEIAVKGRPTSLQVDSSGRMHIVWEQRSSYYSIFDPQGQLVIRPLTVAGYFSQSPSLALGSNQSALVWRQISFAMNSYVYGRTYTFVDSSLSTPAEFNDSYGDTERFNPRVAYTSDSTLFVAWSGQGRQTWQTSGIYGQFSTSSLNLLGANILLSDDTLQTRPNIAPRISFSRDRGCIGVVWLRGDSWGNSLVVRWFTDSGIPLGPSTTTPTDTSRKYYWGHSIATIPAGGYLIAWSAVGTDSVCNIFLRRFDADGLPEGVEIHVNTSPAIWFSEAEVAVQADGLGLVAWESEGTGVRVKAQRFDRQLGKIGSDFSLSPTQDTVDQYWPTVQLFQNRIYASLMNGEAVRGSIMDFSNPPVSVSRDHRAISSELRLRTYPNPFNSSTTVEFAHPSDGRVSLTVYDLLGREILVLAKGDFPGGSHSLGWQAQALPSGMYLLRLNSPSGSAVQKALIVR